MPFIAKCYNGHKTLIDDELDGEMIICPICEEEFIASRNYEELGRVNEETVPIHHKAYIHMGIGLFILIIGIYLVDNLFGFYKGLLGNFFYYLVLILAIFYAFRGLYELIHNRDPFRKLTGYFFNWYYLLRKKIKFSKK